jgi:hypothetical protein
MTAIAELLAPHQRDALEQLAARLDELQALAQLMREVPTPGHPDPDPPPKRAGKTRTKVPRPSKINGRRVTDIHLPDTDTRKATDGIR